jgi:hypothetical protein
MNTLSTAELRLPYKSVATKYEMVTMVENYRQDNFNSHRPAQVGTL